MLRDFILPYALADIASEELSELHDDDTFNPIDPTTVEARLRAAGFGAVEVRSNEFGWAAHATR